MIEVNYFDDFNKSFYFILNLLHIIILKLFKHISDLNVSETDTKWDALIDEDINK